MPMKDVPHPGQIVRQDCLEARGVSVGEAAKALGVPVEDLSEVVDERRGISPELAVRLSKTFGGSPQVWARLQLTYDMVRAMRQAGEIKALHGGHSLLGVDRSV